MINVEEIRFGQQGVCLARPELLVKIGADLLVRRYDIHAAAPGLAMRADELSSWVSEATAALHALAALSHQHRLPVNATELVRLADAYPDLQALAAHSQWTQAARDTLARCVTAIVSGQLDIPAATQIRNERSSRVRRPLALKWPPGPKTELS